MFTIKVIEDSIAKSLEDIDIGSLAYENLEEDAEFELGLYHEDKILLVAKVVTIGTSIEYAIVDISSPCIYDEKDYFHVISFERWYDGEFELSKTSRSDSYEAPSFLGFFEDYDTLEEAFRNDTFMTYMTGIDFLNKKIDELLWPNRGDNGNE